MNIPKSDKRYSDRTENAAVISYTKNGKQLSERLCRAMAGEETCFKPYAFGIDFKDTEVLLNSLFKENTLLVFISAAGIAVRQLAPFLQSKVSDPAVLCIDEKGLHVISLLSGHLGGANAWCRRIAAVIGAEPVITTATDLNDIFAVDLFARENDLLIGDFSMIREVSSRLLRKEIVGFVSELPIRGVMPDGLAAGTLSVPHCGIRIIGGFSPEDRLFDIECRLYAKNLWIGIGCRKGKQKSQLDAFIMRVLEKYRIPKGRIAGLASVDLKKEEPGLLELADSWGLCYVTFSPEELNRVPGSFNGSAFVKKTTGTDAVAERSALCAAGGKTDAKLLVSRTASEGMTVAIAAGIPVCRFDS